MGLVSAFRKCSTTAGDRGNEDVLFVLVDVRVCRVDTSESVAGGLNAAAGLVTSEPVSTDIPLALNHEYVPDKLLLPWGWGRAVGISSSASAVVEDAVDDVSGESAIHPKLR